MLLLDSDPRTSIPPTHTMSYTELLYLHTPDEECLSSKERDKIPRRLEDKSLGIRDQSQSDTNENTKSPRRKDTSPSRHQDTPSNLKGLLPYKYQNHTSRVGDKVPTFYESNPRLKNTSNTFEERKPRHEERKPRHVERNSRFDDRSPKLENTNRRLDGIPTFQYSEFVDLRSVDTRRSNVSLTNGTTSPGRCFSLPRDCGKKSCCTLSPNCTRRLRASSDVGLPRVPSQKVNLVQAGVWQRLRDDDSPRARSFTE